MEKTIELQEKRVEYTLRVSKRARGIRLSVASGGVFTVSAPPFIRTSVIEEFIRKKSEWVLDKIKYFSRFPKPRKMMSTSSRGKHFAEHKPKALALTRERLAHFNERYGFKWNSVTIRNQKSRWGSCSRRGNLNFNYKIALLPPDLADYIIVHELCHLGELNHSRAFWSLVARTLPSHRSLRASLRKVGMSLS
ncbi:MAG: M48 family metallopeptidase [bacterium]|nr:M48 family metallopeptidase [bacterium]